MGLALFAFIAVFILVSSAALLMFYREAMLQRLGRVVSPQSERETVLSGFVRATHGASMATLVQPFQKVLPRSTAEVSIVQKRMIRAGYRKDSDVELFYGAKVLAPIVCGLLATFTGASGFGALFIYGGALGIGFLIPDFWLGNRINARQLKLRLGLPDVLDLMVICIEAGLSLDQAMLRTADELRLSHPALSDELSLVNLEQRAGKPRADAWRQLAERTDVETIRAVVSMLIQADQFGTSVAKVLRVQAETLRVQRRQEVEEQAAKTAVKLVFPLVLFIFPSLFVVVIGPAAIVAFEAFDKYLLN